MVGAGTFLFRGGAVLIPLLLAGALISRAEQSRSEKEFLVFPHSIHLDYEIACTDCHSGAREQASATLPDAGVCYDCHDDPDPAWDSAELIAFFEERSRGEGVLFFQDSLKIEDLKFSHATHMAQGTECSDCHGNIAENKPIQGGDPDFKHACRDCHKILQVSVECATCHNSYRSDRAPTSHQSRDFIRIHGLSVNPDFRRLSEDTCFFCHKTEQCEQCHRENKPQWHDAPSFPERHGLKLRHEQMSLEEAGCAFCHNATGCRACHQQRQPRSHTLVFKNRSHGMLARIDREQCRVCHQQSFCIQCHETKQPVSHGGQFARGRQLHCYSCHFPLQDNGCAVCHKATPGHFSQPRPSDPVHNSATPDSCRTCHTLLPHVDNGADCTICH